MRAPLPRRGIEEFDRHDSFLYAVLGLVSALSGLDDLIDTRAPAVTHTTDGTSGHDVEAVEKDDGLLDALLGVVALRRACAGHFARLAPDRDIPREDARKASDATQSLRGSLLR